MTVCSGEGLMPDLGFPGLKETDKLLFYFIALCLRNDAAAVYRPSVADRSTDIKFVLCSDHFG